MDQEIKEPQNPQTQNEETKPIAPRSPHSSGAHVMLIAAVILLIAVLFGTGGYFLNIHNTPTPTPAPTIPLSPTPTIDPTADWKTYSNTKVGFEIKYPPRFNTPYTTVKGGLGRDRAVSETDDDLLMTWSSSIGIFMLEYYPFSGTAEAVQKNGKKSYALAGQTTEQKVKEITIDTQKALWYVATSSVDAMQQNRIYWAGNSHAFIFYAPFTLSETEVNQILSTFKFTNNQVAISSPPTCTPRPKCLDETPVKCLIVETPDMCPPTQ